MPARTRTTNVVVAIAALLEIISVVGVAALISRGDAPERASTKHPRTSLASTSAALATTPTTEPNVIAETPRQEPATPEVVPPVVPVAGTQEPPPVVVPDDGPRAPYRPPPTSRFAASPASIDLGSAPASTARGVSVTVTNVGDSSGVPIWEISGDSQFEFSNTDCFGGIPPGGSCRIYLTLFTGGAPGTYTKSVAIITDPSGTRVVDVVISAIGAVT